MGALLCTKILNIFILLFTLDKKILKHFLKKTIGLERILKKFYNNIRFDIPLLKNG